MASAVTAVARFHSVTDEATPSVRTVPEVNRRGDEGPWRTLRRTGHGDLMDVAVSSAHEHESARRGTTAIAVAGVVVTAIALILGFSNVEVSGDAGATRNCGSAFDSAVDRSGWEQWWAQDLAEPDTAVRSELLRTTECPGAVNRQLAIVVIAGALGVSMLIVAGLRRRRDAAPRTPPGGSALGRLGLVTTVVGTVLTAGGVVAIVVLVADAESTLFLYVDRGVVALVGLIVLVPTLALVVIGRAVTLVARHLGEADAPPPGSDGDDGIST